MRGKQASSADARRARENAITAAEVAERRVRDLTTENTELHQDINGLLESHNTEMIRMRNALAKGETPKILARDEIISSLRVKLADLRAKYDKTLDVHEKFVTRAIDHFCTEHQMTGADAVQEVLLNWSGGTGYIYDGANTKSLVKLGAAGVKAAQRIDVARGHRSKASVDRDAQQNPVTEGRPW